MWYANASRAIGPCWPNRLKAGASKLFLVAAFAFVLLHIRNASCRQRAIKIRTSHVIPAQRIRGLVNCYWELMAMNTVGGPKMRLGKIRAVAGSSVTACVVMPRSVPNRCIHFAFGQATCALDGRFWNTLFPLP